MTYEEHSLAADTFASWGDGVYQAMRLWLFAPVLWSFATESPWEVVIVLSVLLPAVAINQYLVRRARWHAQRMRAHLNGLKLRERALGDL